jgi:hypothetical protein
MATAIPPRAAEVASNRPVRQKLLGSESAEVEPEAWSIGGGPVLCEGNLRKGTDDLRRKMTEKVFGETYF